MFGQKFSSKFDISGEVLLRAMAEGVVCHVSSMSKHGHVLEG